MSIGENKLDKTLQNCLIGILVMQEVHNSPSNERLNLVKADIAGSLREKYKESTRNKLKSIYPMDVYVSYYNQFGYTYHLLLQLESIIQGKSMPAISSLVDAMFMAEMKNMLLTAGHDLDKVILPLCLKQSKGEGYIALGGKTVITVPGDLMIEDKKGIISSILRGPDSRTNIDVQTSRVLFTVYAPPGIKDNLIYQHLNDIESYVKIFSEESSTGLKAVLGEGEFNQLDASAFYGDRR
jgi:DNA/RNA-binding domain of Phe-tRNA-synthetase-like protein